MCWRGCLNVCYSDYSIVHVHKTISLIFDLGLFYIFCSMGYLIFFKSPPINGLCNYFCFLIISPNSVEFSNLTKFVSESKEDVSSTSVQVTVKKGVKRKADTTTPLSSDQVCDQFSSD